MRLKYFYVASFAVTMVATASVQAQSIDTSRWNLERNASWGFVAAVPPGWTVLNMHVADLQFVVRQDLSNGRKLMCQVQAVSQPETIGLSQEQLNSYIVGKGPPSPQETSTMANSSGFPTTVHSSELRWVNGFPAYSYDIAMEIRSTTNPIQQRTLSEWIYVPGKNYGVNCTASANSLSVSEQVYSEYTPIFRGFLEAFFVTPTTIK